MHNTFCACPELLHSLACAIIVACVSDATVSRTAVSGQWSGNHKLYARSHAMTKQLSTALWLLALLALSWMNFMINYS